MFRVYLRAYGWDMFLAGLCRILGDTAAFVPPFAVAGIVHYVMGIHDNVQPFHVSRVLNKMQDLFGAQSSFLAQDHLAKTTCM